MDLHAAEISAILKEQIANFGTETEVAEVGQVLSVGDGIARVYGLDNVQAGELVHAAVDEVVFGHAAVVDDQSPSRAQRPAHLP